MGSDMCIRDRQYAALLPCLVSALLGVFISGQMGHAPESFVLKAEVAATPLNLVRVILLGALLAALSIFFCELLHAAPKLYKKFLPNAYLRVAAGGVLILALTKLLGTTDYNGAGAAVIEAHVPLASMFGYATDLRSKTQGRATYSMEPSHYVELPKNLQETLRGTRKG